MVIFTSHCQPVDWPPAIAIRHGLRLVPQRGWSANAASPDSSSPTNRSTGNGPRSAPCQSILAALAHCQCRPNQSDAHNLCGCHSLRPIRRPALTPRRPTTNHDTIRRETHSAVCRIRMHFVLAVGPGFRDADSTDAGVKYIWKMCWRMFGR